MNRFEQFKTDLEARASRFNKVSKSRDTKTTTTEHDVIDAMLGTIPRGVAARFAETCMAQFNAGAQEIVCAELVRMNIGDYDPNYLDQKALHRAVKRCRQLLINAGWSVELPGPKGRGNKWSLTLTAKIEAEELAAHEQWLRTMSQELLEANLEGFGSPEWRVMIADEMQRRARRAA